MNVLDFRAACSVFDQTKMKKKKKKIPCLENFYNTVTSAKN